MSEENNTHEATATGTAGSTAGTGAAMARETQFNDPFHGWADRKIKEQGHVTLSVEGAEVRVGGVTPNGYLKIQRAGGEYESLKLTDSIVEELMPQLFI